MVCSCDRRLLSMGTDEWWETKPKKHVTDEKKSEIKDEVSWITMIMIEE